MYVPVAPQNAKLTSAGLPQTFVNSLAVEFLLPPTNDSNAASFSERRSIKPLVKPNLVPDVSIFDEDDPINFGMGNPPTEHFKFRDFAPDVALPEEQAVI